MASAPAVFDVANAAHAAAGDDLAACRAALRNGSRTFLAASLLLPRAVHEPACALYAFCRLADDAVDGQIDGRLGGGSDGGTDGASAADAASRAVATLRQRLALAYRGTPMATPADRALAAVVARFDIPRALPEALLEGFEWDAAGRHYETLADLHEYAARVAGAVGAMMALLMGVRSAEGLARACDLGVAMQLSNIARDVGEDARMGRLYLPRQWLREAGIAPDAWLANPVFSPALGCVVQRVLDAADALYARVDAGVARLPWSCRPGINAARYLYAGIGHEVARRGLDSVSQRAAVPGSRKVLLLARALVSLNPAPARQAAPALAATQYLVDAVGPVAAPASAPRRPARWNVKQRALWVIDLFERLERREQMGLQRGR
ncbi:phytoene/squalene synthase family protein [soil metagenome]